MKAKRKLSIQKKFLCTFATLAVISGSCMGLIGCGEQGAEREVVENEEDNLTIEQGNVVEDTEESTQSEIVSTESEETTVANLQDNGWTTIGEFSGDFSDGSREALSDIFALSGGQVRISYEVTATSVGGNALIYVLKEGATKTTDENGAFSIATQDIMVMGTNTGSQIIKKDAGNYYIDINTADISNYKIVVEEKVAE